MGDPAADTSLDFPGLDDTSSLDVGEDNSIAAALDDVSLGADEAVSDASASISDSLGDIQLGMDDTGSLGMDDTSSLGVELDSTELLDDSLGTVEGLDMLGEGSNDDSLLEGTDNLESGDEMDTMMDLAKAYIDMGDMDGARSTLEEVLEAGNEDQKRQAEELLHQNG